MDVFEAIQKRKSIRAYETTPVPEETVKKILEAARLAPSAVNFQPWHFIVVTGSEKRKDLSKGVFAKFLAETPVVIVACGDTKASPKWCSIDVAIAVENMVLAATAEGLGTCWVGSFDENQVKALLKIPEKSQSSCSLGCWLCQRKRGHRAENHRFGEETKNAG